MQQLDLGRAMARPRLRPFYARHGKRALDLGVGLALLPLLALPVAVMWAMARRDAGPGFYGHRRVGRDGRPFRCWKIRTMRPDSDAALARHLAADPAAAAEWRTTRKLRRDPRLTPLGRRLRRAGLDELPQIWNVVTGEMSFVGPRPITAEELELHGAARESYLSVRPGITGLWQVFGRAAEGRETRIAFDRAYCRRITLGTDLVLIASTVLLPFQSTST